MRTGEELQRDVLDELASDPKIDASTIGVTVGAEGVVTLTGTVGSYAERFMAERSVQKSRGVRGVVNELDVNVGTIGNQNDSHIGEAAVRALERDRRVPASVHVSVRDGCVTLVGEVDWEYQRRSAAELVRSLFDVKGVNNDITVRARTMANGEVIRPADVNRRILEAFERHAQIDANQISVEAEKGVVVLRGTVQSWTEREEAENAAWAAPGVSHIENLLAIAEHDQRSAGIVAAGDGR